MLGDNIRFLRKSSRISQQELSEAMQIPRTTLGDYERGKTEPNMAKLVDFAKYFDVRVDDLLRIPMQFGDQKMPDHELRILAITVDNDNNGNIDLVQSKASAGYIESFQDPEYVGLLPKIHIPNMPEGTFRAFEIEGESMLPMQSGTMVICRFEENIINIKDGKTYVVVSQEHGLVFKRLRLNNEKKEVIMLSDNSSYVPFTLEFSEIAEVWKYHAHIGFSDEKIENSLSVEQSITDIQHSINRIEQQLSN